MSFNEEQRALGISPSPEDQSRAKGVWRSAFMAGVIVNHDGAGNFILTPSNEVAADVLAHHKGEIEEVLSTLRWIFAPRCPACRSRDLALADRPGSFHRCRACGLSERVGYASPSEAQAPFYEAQKNDAKAFLERAHDEIARRHDNVPPP